MCSYAMLIKRWYFPIFIFVGLGKVAGGFHGIGGEIRRPPGSNDKPDYKSRNEKLVIALNSYCPCILTDLINIV